MPKKYSVRENNKFPRTAIDLFETDWIVLFDLWKLPMNSFCNKTDVSSPNTNRVVENLKKDLKNKFSQVFSEGLGRCIKDGSKVRDQRKCVFVGNI